MNVTEVRDALQPQIYSIYTDVLLVVFLLVA